jgi:hypothetical protein
MSDIPEQPKRQRRPRNPTKPRSVAGEPWFPFIDWCENKHFTPQHGYQLIDRGELATVKVGRCRYVTEEEDRAFTARALANAMEGLGHNPARTIAR